MRRFTGTLEHGGRVICLSFCIYDNLAGKSFTLIFEMGDTQAVVDAVVGGITRQPVKGAKFNRDASRILTWSDDGIARLWAVGQNEPLQTFEHEKSVEGPEFNRDGTHANLR